MRPTLNGHRHFVLQHHRLPAPPLLLPASRLRREQKSGDANRSAAQHTLGNQQGGGRRLQRLIRPASLRAYQLHAVLLYRFYLWHYEHMEDVDDVAIECVLRRLFR